MNKKRIVFFSVLFLFTVFIWGQISLPRLISDGAILQRGTEVEIWGWASPNEHVELHFNQIVYKTKADIQGTWELVLPAQQAGGPYEMVFKGTNEITLKNILFGDVWVCSGQSNMELSMQRLKDAYPEVVQNAKNDKIRQYLVRDAYDFNTAHQDFDAGSWKVANQDNILEFSGVAYFFAKDLYAKYQVPIGLINAALGGSPVESWMSEDALKSFPDAYTEMQKFKDTNLINKIEKSDASRQQAWYGLLNENDKGFSEEKEWFLKDYHDADWSEMEVPGFWADNELGQVNGVVWFRKHINITENMLGKEAKLWLGRIVDQDHVYVNGAFVGTTGYQYPPRKYTINSNLLKLGDNTVTVRVINEQGRGGFITDKPYFLSVGNDTVALKGKWKYKLGTTMEPLQGPTFIRWKPGGLYNKMISPILKYTIKGAIWYQGESNTGNPDPYFKTFPALIKNWRNKWQLGDFPFIYVQLTNFMEETTEPTESNWAKLRQAQLETLSVPNTGMAVTIDLGEWNDIHPLNKAAVGSRLAQEAFKLGYGERITKVSPTPKEYKFSKKKVTITFQDAEIGLKSNNGEALQYFEISNDGKIFQKASATIKHNKVVVWKDKLNNPVAIRYAWANNPLKANLFSNAGLPVSPFEIKKQEN
tara:strand:+ start:6647 stop:8584 length:1938 start_codon:yes stop_codon:yes gene_type:complete